MAQGNTHQKAKPCSWIYHTHVKLPLSHSLVTIFTHLECYNYPQLDKASLVLVFTQSQPPASPMRSPDIHPLWAPDKGSPWGLEYSVDSIWPNVGSLHWGQTITIFMNECTCQGGGNECHFSFFLLCHQLFGRKCTIRLIQFSWHRLEHLNVDTLKSGHLV